MRIKHYEQDELASDIVLQYSEEIVKQLWAELISDIKEITAMGRARSKRYKRFDVYVNKYYQQNKKKREVAILSGEINLLPHKKKN